MRIESTICHVYSHTLVLLRHVGLKAQSTKHNLKNTTNFKAFFPKIYVEWLSFSFTLYPAHSRVGRGNLVLGHSVPYFSPSSGGIEC